MTSLLAALIALAVIASCNAGECIGNDPCIFLGKDLGWVKYDGGEKHKALYPPKSDSWSKPETTLFVTMASFRDKLCPVTLFNIFTKARYPQRITVGVVQQNEEEDVDCLHEYCRMMATTATNYSHMEGCPFENQVRILRVAARDAKGPTWGRAKGAQLLRDEEFCMQTDSHMDYVPHWDDYMMQMWALTGNEYGILSTYVADVQQMSKILPGKKGINNMQEVPHLCMVTFHGAYDMVRNWGTKCMRNMPHPKLTNIVWGAGLSFSKCHAERKVPYDPHIPHIFDGEEYSRGLRFWTHGYDVYTPHRIFVLHNYQVSQSDPKHSKWGQNRDDTEGTAQQSVKRLQTVFHVKRPEGEPLSEEDLRIVRSRYGLGDRRTVDQAIAFSGLDTRNGVMMENKCGNNLEYVPWVEHPKGAEYVPRFDPVTEAPLDVPDKGSIYYDPDNDPSADSNAAAVLPPPPQHQIPPPQQLQPPLDPPPRPPIDLPDPVAAEEQRRVRERLLEEQRLQREKEIREQQLKLEPEKPENPDTISGDSAPHLRFHDSERDLLRVRPGRAIDRGDNFIDTLVEDYIYDQQNRSILSIIIIFALLAWAVGRYQLFRTGKEFKRAKEKRSGGKGGGNKVRMPKTSKKNKFVAQVTEDSDSGGGESDSNAVPVLGLKTV